MKKKFYLPLFLVTLFLLIPAKLSHAGQGGFSLHFSSSRRGYHYRRHHFGPRKIIAPYRRHHYSYWPSYYYRRPTRYHLPWDRPKVEVHTSYTGGLRFYKPLPTVIVQQSVSQPKVLVQPTSFVSRQEYLIESVLRHASSDRLLAARELAEYKNVSSIAVLVDVLFSDADWQVRHAAVESLGEIGSTLAYEPLLRIAAGEADEDVRHAAQDAAQAIKEKAGAGLYSGTPRRPQQHGTQKMAEYLEDLRFGRSVVREKAVKKLKQYRDNRAAAALINTLINDRDKEVRKEAAESLADMADRMALPFLKDARQNDLEKSVRRASEKAVEKIYNTIL